MMHYLLTFPIERRERHVQEMFDRACTLYPRTMEFLKQLGVADEMAQIGFVGCSHATFRDGKQTTGKAWQSLFSDMDDSFHNYIPNIRQKSSERVFASKYETNFQ